MKEQFEHYSEIIQMALKKLCTCFFIWRDFDGGKSISRDIGMGGPENLNFFWALKWHDWAQKSRDFQSPPLFQWPM